MDTLYTFGQGIWHALERQGVLRIGPKSERKRPLDRSRRRLMHNMDMNQKDRGCEDMKFIHLNIKPFHKKRRSS
jgi:hypothetical protein